MLFLDLVQHFHSFIGLHGNEIVEGFVKFALDTAVSGMLFPQFIEPAYLPEDIACILDAGKALDLFHIAVAKFNRRLDHGAFTKVIPGNQLEVIHTGTGCHPEGFIQRSAVVMVNGPPDAGTAAALGIKVIETRVGAANAKLQVRQLVGVEIGNVRIVLVDP